MKTSKQLKRTLATLLCMALVLSCFPAVSLVTSAAEASPGLWQQVKNIDKTTGGAWHSVGGYGDEQAILLGMQNDKPDPNYNGNGMLISKWGEGSSTTHVGNRYSPYARHAYYTNNTDTGIKLSTDVDSGGMWYVPTTSEVETAEGMANLPVTPSYLEAPENPDAGYYYPEGIGPRFNVLTVFPTAVSDTETGYYNLTNYPLETGVTKREVMSFDIPDAKANNEYLFTVHLNTQPTVTDPNGDFYLYVIPEGSTTAVEKVKLNTVTDIGKTGAYITFKVKGDFTVFMDTPASLDNKFGFSAFFFDEVPAVTQLTNGIWVDKTTGANWRTVGGYGTEQAVLLGMDTLRPDSVNVNHGNGFMHSGWQQVSNTAYTGGRYNPLGADCGVYYTNDTNCGIKLSSETGAMFIVPTSEETTTVNGLTVPKDPTYLEAPANPDADYLANPPHFNIITTWPSAPSAEGAGCMNSTTYPLDEGMALRRVLSFDMPVAEPEKGTYFTVHLNTQAMASEYPLNVQLYVVDAQGNASQKVTLDTINDIGKTGAYVTFMVTGDFSVVLDIPATLNQLFGYTAFFFDRDAAPVNGVRYDTPAEPDPTDPTDPAPTDPQPTDPAPALTLWDQIGVLDKTTGGAWRTVGGYGTEQAVLLGMSNELIDAHGDGYLDGGYSTGVDSSFVGGLYNGMGQYCGVYYTNNTDTGIKIPTTTVNNEVVPDTGTMFIVPASDDIVWDEGGPAAGKGLATLPSASSYLEAPANPDAGYRDPHFNIITGWHSTPASSAEGYLNSDNYPLDEGMASRKTLFFDVPADKEGNEYYFTVHLNTRATVTDPDGDLYLYLIAQDGTVGQKVKLNAATDIGKTGAYITFLVKGDFTVVLDMAGTLYNYFGFTAFFFDSTTVEAPLPEDVIDHTNWTVVGEVDKTTGGAWRTVGGYGTEQAVLLGMDTLRPDSVNVNHGNGFMHSGWQQVSDTAYTGSRYNPLGANCGVYYTNDTSNGIKLSSETGAMFIVPTSEETTTVNGLTVPKDPSYLEAPENPDADYTTNPPHFNIVTAWHDRSDTGLGSGGTGYLNTDTYPLDAGMTYRKAMPFDIPAAKEGNTYYFTTHLNTWAIADDAVTNGDVCLYVIAADGTVSEKVKLNTQTDIGKTGVYVTFEVKGDFTVVLDTAGSLWNKFGFSAFFFDAKPGSSSGESSGSATSDWAQVGQIDTTTQGAWSTVGGYGTEQALLLGWGGTAYANSLNYGVAYGGRWNGANNQNQTDTVGWAYHLYGASDHKSGGTDYITYPTPNPNRIYHYNKSTTSSTADITAALEAPEGFSAALPKYNSYTAQGVKVGDSDAAGCYFTENPLTDGYTYRHTMTFEMPAAKAENEYYFTVYADTKNFSTDPSYNFQLSFTDLDGTPKGEKITLNTSEFGKTGGYVTFKVKGSFRLHLDKPEEAITFGVSAFFFDEIKDQAKEVSITLDGTIGVNFGMQISDQALADTGAKITFSQAGKSDVVKLLNDYEDKNGYQYYTTGVAAKEMADIITAQIQYSDGSLGSTSTYAVMKFAQTWLSRDDCPATLKDLLVRMVNYGAYSQIYFGHNEGSLANAFLSANARTSGLASVTQNTVRAYANACNVGTDVQLQQASLILKSETTMRLFFKKTDALGKTFKLGGNVLTATDRGSYTYVDIQNIAAAKLDNTYTVEIYDGNTLVSTVSYSPMTYIYTVLNQSTDENLKNLAKSLYLYNQAANAHFVNR